MNTLSSQVERLANEGHILEMATAIVAAEQTALYRYGTLRAEWKPMWKGVFSESLKFNDINLGIQPKDVTSSAFAIICGADFEVGNEGEAFSVEAATEQTFTEDEWVLGVVRKFARVYTSAGYTHERPEVTILPPLPLYEPSDNLLPIELPHIVDNRRVRLD